MVFMIVFKILIISVNTEELNKEIEKEGVYFYHTLAI